MSYCLRVGARASRLAQAQVAEVQEEIRYFFKEVVFDPLWMTTSGDRDLKTDLKTLGKSDFFTKEIDHALLQGLVRIAIHSAKDLPDPLPEGLEVVAITAGKDPRDMLMGNLFEGARVGVSSERREKMIKIPVSFVPIRGTIEQRIAQLDKGEIDALIVPEAALLRLGIERGRVPLEGEPAPLQGQLAVVSRKDDLEMKNLFAPLDVRLKTVHFGLHPHHHPKREYLTHFPLIRTQNFPLPDHLVKEWPSVTAEALQENPKLVGEKSACNEPTATICP